MLSGKQNKFAEQVLVSTRGLHLVYTQHRKLSEMPRAKSQTHPLLSIGVCRCTQMLELAFTLFYRARHCLTQPNQEEGFHMGF